MTAKKIAALEAPTLSAGESVVLQPVDIDDAERYLKMVADNYDRLSEWMRVPKPPGTIEERRKAQAADIARGADGQGYWWLIEFEGELAGTIALHQLNAVDKWTLVGYWLDENFTGRGIMTRSLKAVIDWSFAELGLNRVEIHASLNNPASTAIPERLGIRRESIRRKSEVINGVALDMASYAALADNWPPEPPKRALPHKEIRVDDEIVLRSHHDRDNEVMWKALDTGREYLGKYLPWIGMYKTKNEYTRLHGIRRSEKDRFDGSGEYIIEYNGELAGALGFSVPNATTVLRSATGFVRTSRVEAS